MPNMLDYITWRGDLSIRQDALNENDILILAQLAYVAFGEYIPGPDKPEARVTLEDAVAWLVGTDPDGEQIHQTGFMWKNNQQLLRALRGSRRFGEMGMFAYVDSVSAADEKQFAAVTYEVGDGSALVTYRGTDDTLIGWKEDLNMSYDTPVPAQTEATEYLERIAAVFPGPLRVTGHSKGGNLAVYAAAHCSDAVAERLVSVISHDGPGLDQATIDSAGYARIRERLKVFIPHFSLVGMLLEHENNYTVVQSDAKNVLQHDAFSWQMQGTRMLYADAPSEASLSTNQVLRQWMQTLSGDQRKLFIEAVYEIASTTYGDKIPENVVETNWTLSAPEIISAVLKLDPHTRSMFSKSLLQLFSTAIKNIRLPWQKEEKDAEKLEAVEEPVPVAAPVRGELGEP